MPIEVQSPGEIARDLAKRVKVLRLEREWTQQETALRAGVTLASYRRFERSGQISIDRLLRLAIVLDARGGFGALFQPPAARSLAELERQLDSPRRKRGKRRNANP